MVAKNEDIIKQNLNLYKGKRLKIKDKYIQNNHINKIFKSLFKKENNKILVTSVTGSGKTYSFLNYVQKNEIKTIFLAPYKSTTWQTFVSYEHDNTVGFWGKKSVELSGDETVIIATYDKSKQIFKQMDCSEYILIIDEAHNLIGQYGFRKEAIKNINKLSKKVNTIIHITATPIGLSSKYDMIYNFKKDKKLERAFIIDSNSLSELINKLNEHKKTNHIDIIRINNKKKQQKIKEILVKDNLYSEDEILILNSDVKGNDEFRYLINNDKINRKISLLLTTSLIDDGVNIKNNNINNIYFFGSLDFNAIVQFPNRNRNGFKSMYIFNKHKPERKAFNFNKRFEYIFNVEKNTVEKYNNILRELNYSPETKNKEEELTNITNSITNILESGFLSYNDKINKYYIDEMKILLRVYQKLNGTLSNHNILKSVLKLYAGFENVERINKLKNDKYKLEDKKIFGEALNSIINDKDINREVAVKRLIQWSDISTNVDLVDNNIEIKRIENKYCSLNKIARSQKRKVNKLGRLYHILYNSKIDHRIIYKVLRLYEDKVTPKTLKGKIGFAIIINSKYLFNNLSPIKSKKINRILTLENTTKTNSELKYILNKITGKKVKSPKVFLDNFFEVETTTKRDENGKAKRFTIIKNRVQINDIYGIDLTHTLKCLNNKQLNKWTNNNFKLLAA